jgi:hypothetical protein
LGEQTGLGHRFPPRGLKGTAVIIGLLACSKHTLVADNGLAIPHDLSRGEDGLPQAILIAFQGVSEFFGAREFSEIARLEALPLTTG